MAALSTIALIAAAGGLASSVYSGQQQAKAQKKALGRQEQAQKEAQTQAQRQQRLSEERMRAANMAEPDTAAIMRAESEARRKGVGGTMLTGPQGVKQGEYNVGGSTLLGE